MYGNNLVFRLHISSSELIVKVGYIQLIQKLGNEGRCDLLRLHQIPIVGLKFFNEIYVVLDVLLCLRVTAQSLSGVSFQKVPQEANLFNRSLVRQGPAYTPTVYRLQGISHPPLPNTIRHLDINLQKNASKPPNESCLLPLEVPVPTKVT